MSLKRKDPPTSSRSTTDDAKKPKKNADLTSFFGPPKAKPAANNGASSTNGAPGAAAGADDPVPPVKFDKDKWAASLTEEQRNLLKLEIDTLDPSWLAQLKDEVTSREFLDLKRFLQKEIDSKQKIYPPLEDVYSWFVSPVPSFFLIIINSLPLLRTPRHTRHKKVKHVY
jgi:uracil-DNA glycosylase